MRFDYVNSILLVMILSPVYSFLRLSLTRRTMLSTQTTVAIAVRLEAAKKTLGSKGKDEKFYCSECGAEHINWVGRCNVCKAWNTVKQFRVPKAMPVGGPRRSFTNADVIADNFSGGSWAGNVNDRGGWTRDMTGVMSGKEYATPMSAVDVSVATSRMSVWSEEVNRVLGGGLVKGSVVLLAGEPGIGKSTLMLQLASGVADFDALRTVVYMTGEENKEQVASRAHRLGLKTDNVFIICDGDVDIAIDEIMSMNPMPSLVIVDSVQTMYSSSCQGSVGSVPQIRDSTATFVRFAKSLGSSVILAGHVTKAGDIAGPRLLEHMVDTVLYLEGSNRADYRILRNVKNRFGSTSEMGVFTMEKEGLQDVKNPSELFMSSAVISEGVEGATVVVMMEGTRPLLAEVQCLVGEYSPLRIPKRTSDGFPLQRLQLIIAVLQKKLGIDLSSREVYVNVVGGLKINDPDSDLGVAVTIISSYMGMKVKPGLSFIGELGLGGEVRGGKGCESKARESIKMGFNALVAPASAISARLRYHKKSGTKAMDDDIGEKGQSNMIPVYNLEEALRIAFGCDDINFLLRKRKKSSNRRKYPIIGESQDDEEREDLRERSYAQRFENDSDSDGVENIRNIFPPRDFKFSDE